MRGLRLALPVVLACVACDYYTDSRTDEGGNDPMGDDDPIGDDPIDVGMVQYQLIESGQIAGAGQIAGITWDGEHVWLAYYRPIGGYYDNDEVSIVELSADGAELVRHEYDDDYTPPNGLAWVDGALWINYNAEGGSGSQVMREIDPVTGSVRRQFATD